MRCGESSDLGEASSKVEEHGGEINKIVMRKKGSKKTGFKQETIRNKSDWSWRNKA